MHSSILSAVQNSQQALSQLIDPNGLLFIETLAYRLAACFASGHKVIIAGNGGSLCDAAHFAEELTGQFRHKRSALPAICLSEPGYLSCVANDMGYEEVFARGVEAFGKKGDIFIGLSTSGNSRNLIRAFQEAGERHLYTVAFLGKDGGALKEVADLELIIEGLDTSDRIQEAHMTAIHIAIEQMENLLFYSEQKVTAEDLAAKLT